MQSLHRMENGAKKLKMGWWGMAFNEKDDWNKRYFDNFIRDTDPEYYIAIVDCHI